MEMDSEKTRVFTCEKYTGTVIRGIAIVLLFLGHSGWFPHIASGTVSLFLLLSGYGLTVSWLNTGLSQYWIKKVVKVYLPYLIVTAFILLVFGCKSKKMILFSLVGLDFGCLKIGTMWYISYQLFWYVAFYVSVLITIFVFRGTKTKTYQCVFLVFATFAFIYPCMKLESIGAWHDGVGAYLYRYMFPIGVLLGSLSKVAISKITKLICWIIVLAVTSGLVIKYGNDIGSRNEYTVFASALGLMVLALSQCLVFDKSGEDAETRTSCKCVGTHSSLMNSLAFLGGMSYSIYLWEGIIATRVYSWTNFSIRELQDVAYFAISVVCGYFYQKIIINRINQSSLSTVSREK